MKISIENIHLRDTVVSSDVDAVREIVRSTGFFYDIEIPVAVELVEERLLHGEESGYYFIFAEVEEQTVAYSCFGPIAGTEGAFDLYWIATHHDYRGKGIGQAVLLETHRQIVAMGGRLVIAETSSLEKYAPTRYFYETSGYTKEAGIDDFYKPGDGKVFYVKRF
jgi:GNAT superfamily N-acetyltransferase